MTAILDRGQALWKASLLRGLSFDYFEQVIEKIKFPYDNSCIYGILTSRNS